MTLIDTHSHIHLDNFDTDLADVLDRAQAAGVAKMLCVGVNDDDSARAIALAKQHPDTLRATVGLHPHDADRGQSALKQLAKLAAHPIVVAIGECGLDQFKSTTSPAEQELALRFQIELAHTHDLPMVFHVRNAFGDFWRILADYPGTRGVVHSFTAGPLELAAALEHGLCIALNGILTFTKDPVQLEAARQVPLDRLILETDCPFLAPVPMRGRRNEPAYIAHTAEFLANLRGESLEDLSNATAKNAETLFNL
jgi:TatD DNase family protein